MLGVLCRPRLGKYSLQAHLPEVCKCILSRSLAAHLPGNLAVHPPLRLYFVGSPERRPSSNEVQSGLSTARSMSLSVRMRSPSLKPDRVVGSSRQRQSRNSKTVLCCVLGQEILASSCHANSLSTAKQYIQNSESLAHGASNGDQRDLAAGNMCRQLGAVPVPGYERAPHQRELHQLPATPASLHIHTCAPPAGIQSRASGPDPGPAAPPTRQTAAGAGRRGASGGRPGEVQGILVSVSSVRSPVYNLAS